VSWIDIVGGEPPGSEWRDIAAVPALLDRARALAQRLGCYVKTIDGDPVAFVEREKPEIVLFDELAPAVAVAEKFRTGVVDAFDADLDVQSRLLVMRTRAYGGRVIREWVCPTSRPQICVIRTG
jgi:electron transfer flavoprotein alpha subunit